MTRAHLRFRVMVCWLAAFAEAIAGQSSGADVPASDFTSAAEINLVGDALSSSGAIRLTPARMQHVGAMWLSRKVYIASGFETQFRFQITECGGLGGGADGLAFVLQNSGPDAIGGPGQSGGFAVESPRYGGGKGIANSIAVFFDTFRNGDEDDPSDNYVGIVTHRSARAQRWPPRRLARSGKLPAKLKDGRVHTARISYHLPVMTVVLDDVQIVRSVVDLRSIADANGEAWVGFTASTGMGYANHDLLKWDFRAESRISSSDSTISQVSSTIDFHLADCMEGRNLCTPARSSVSPVPGRANEYLIQLPAHLEWGASVPNPKEAPVEILQADGVVCIDSGAGAECTSALGNSTQASGTGFLSPPAPRGALIWQTTNGVTRFSVNDRSGSAFRDNQGFFRLHVRIGN